VAVAAGQTQGRVDAAGEYWLGELARNVFSVNASSTFAIREGTSTRDAATTAATGTMLRDVVRAIDADATGTYFGARIPTNQVLAVAPADGSVIYGIGTYRDPGNCRGGTLRPVVHRFMQGNMSNLTRRGDPFSATFYLPDGSDFADEVSVYNSRVRLPAVPGWGACTQAQLMQPPPPAPGTPAAPGWQPAARPSAGAMTSIRGPLRAAALCQIEQALRTRNRGFRFAGGAELCVARSRRSTDLPDSINLYRPNNGGYLGVLPNLQVSVRNDLCQPWEIGTSQGITRSSSGAVNELVTAVGMQCPVIDLTPNQPRRADLLTGEEWNCVSANPQGRIIRKNLPFFLGLGVPPPQPPQEVTSSLRDLNVRSMGGYCPNWGWQPMPAGSTNISQGVSNMDLGRLCSPGFAHSVSNGALNDALPVRPYEGSAAGRVVPRDVAMPCSLIRGGVVLQFLIPFLTTYWEPRGERQLRPSAERLARFRQLGIGYRAPGWSTNNAVAGDFVVGPLYTSNAVGAFVPGLSPGGPVATAPPRAR